MPKKSYLGHGQNARLRAIIRSELLTRVPTQLHLAPLLGMPQGNLSRFLDGKVGVGAPVALRVAFLLNRSLDDVLGIGTADTLSDPEEHRYPSRLLAARAAYLDGVPVEQVEVQWRGPLAFVSWKGRDGRRQRLSWWPDTLPPARRRELRLAANATDTAPHRSAMAP
jgi:plasmid maintenance system antidote protein VapI